MPQVIKHPLKYQEERRTFLLNAAGKDLLGRHRGHVKYGLKCRPAGTEVQIGPGALYTAYGTTVYLDVDCTTTTTPGLMVLNLSDTNVISVDDSGTPRSIFSVFARGYYPIVVALYAEFNVYGTTDETNIVPEAEAVETGADAASKVLFKARCVPYDSNTFGPTFNIVAQRPVYMNQGAQNLAPELGFDTRADHSGISVVQAPSGSNEDTALKFNEILIGHLIIGCDSAGAFPTQVADGSTNEWADGVAYVPARNSWEALEDFVGTDILIGRNEKRVVGEATGAALGVDAPTALNQLVGLWEAGATTTVYPANPKYGSKEGFNGSLASEFYRLPSFLRDGDSLLNALRRMDFVLRLWMNRTGDQKLVGDIQDGAELMPELATLMDSYNSITNNNTVAYLNTVTPTASLSFIGGANKVLQGGTIGHEDLQATNINAIAGSERGDTHYGALRAIETAIYGILTSALGISVTQNELRRATAWDAGTYRVYDRPYGYSAAVSNALYLSAGNNPYIADGGLKAAVQAALTRTNYLPSNNLLVNGSFLNYGTGATAYGWLTNIGALPLLVDGAATAPLATAGKAYQDVTLPLYSGPAFPRVVSAVVEIECALDCVLEIIGLNAGSTTDSVTVPIGTTGARVTKTASLVLTGNPTSLRWQIRNTTAGNANVTIYQAGLYFGMAPVTQRVNNNVDYVLRGNATMPLLANLNAGSHKITGLTDGSDDADATAYHQLIEVRNTEIAAREANDLLWATHPATADIDADGHYINNVLTPFTATDAANKSYVDALLAALRAESTSTITDAVSYNNTTTLGVGLTHLGLAIAVGDILTISLTVVGYYVFELEVMYVTPVAAGFAFQLTTTGTVTPRTLTAYMLRQNNSGAVSPNGPSQGTEHYAVRNVVPNSPNVIQGIDADVSGSANDTKTRLLKISGGLYIGGPSTITFEWAKEASSGSAAVVYDGSWIRAHKTNRV